MKDLTMHEYERLVRDSEQLAVIKKLAETYTPGLDSIIRNITDAEEDYTNDDN